MKMTIYQKPTCTTCRKLAKVLNARGVKYDAVNYYVNPLPKNKLKALLKKMKVGPRDVLRTREPIYKKLKLGERKLSDARLIDLMVRYPDLLQRPIAEKGARAVLARPPERISEIL